MQNVSAERKPLVLNVSPRPRLSRMVQPGPDWPFGTALDLKHCLWLTSGRAAIALALQHAGLNPGDEVLVPGYACLSMIEPVRFLGLAPAFYALDGDLCVGLSEIERRCTAATRALLVTRFHGFPCESAGLYDYCQRHDIVVIEDRAHAFFGGAGDNADYVTYSATKFFPVFEGGLLTSKHRNVEEIRTERAPAAFQLKAALWPYEYASAYDASFPGLGPIASMLRIKHMLKTRVLNRYSSGDSAARNGPAAADGGAELEPYWIAKSMSWSSRHTILASDLGWIAARRRHNWMRLAQNLSNAGSVHMIHSSLDDDIVPYAAAITVADPESAARTLRSVGVPLYRWDTFAIETADESLRSTVELSSRILQIPTHQAMTDSDIDRMSEAILLSAEGPGAADQ